MQNPTPLAQCLPTTGTIDTPMGSLDFEGGYPTQETVFMCQPNPTSIAPGRCPISKKVS